MKVIIILQTLIGSPIRYRRLWKTQDKFCWAV